MGLDLWEFLYIFAFCDMFAKYIAYVCLVLEFIFCKYKKTSLIQLLNRMKSQVATWEPIFANTVPRYTNASLDVNFGLHQPRRYGGKPKPRHRSSGLRNGRTSVNELFSLWRPSENDLFSSSDYPELDAPVIWYSPIRSLAMYLQQVQDKTNVFLTEKHL